MPDGFKIKSSLIRRLRGIMVAIAVFIILVFVGTFLVSNKFVKSLSLIHQANIVLSSITQTAEVIEDSSNNLTRLGELEDTRSLKYAFKDSQSSLKYDLKTAAQAIKNVPEVAKHLNQALDSVAQYEKKVNLLVAKHTKASSLKTRRQRRAFQSEVAAAKKDLSNIKENVRLAQIELKKVTDSTFTTLFENRHRPAQVTVGLSLLFFSFVVIFGFSITRRIQRSLNNLTRTSKIAARGNLGVQAEVLEDDEMGQLTHNFNIMISSLDSKQQQLTDTLGRMKKLQEITAAFSEALTVQQVCDVTINFSAQALNSKVALIALLNNDGERIEIKKYVSEKGALIQEGEVIRVSDKRPLTEAIRYQQPVYVTNLLELNEHYPELEAYFQRHQLEAVVSVPLVMASETLGGISFYFEQTKNFTEEEKQFILALSRQCAQALNRAQLYDEAKASVHARDEFISIASHELKTPLTPLKLQLQMIDRQIEKKDKVNPEKLSALIKNSDNHIRRLSKLIEDLLDVSRITLKTLALNYEPLKLDSLIKDVISQYGHQLKDALQKVELNLDKNVEIEGDKVRLEQVLINLLTNAAKYAPGKPIKISLSKLSPEMVRVSVEDQGPGIAEKNHLRIFDRFERVRNTNNIGGLGLGLYISAQIVEAHQGKFWVESVLGEGATFIFDLPIKRAKP